MYVLYKVYMYNCTYIFLIETWSVNLAGDLSGKSDEKRKRKNCSRYFFNVPKAIKQFFSFFLLKICLCRASSHGDIWVRSESVGFNTFFNVCSESKHWHLRRQLSVQTIANELFLIHHNDYFFISFIDCFYCAWSLGRIIDVIFFKKQNSFS